MNNEIAEWTVETYWAGSDYVPGQDTAWRVEVEFNRVPVFSQTVMAETPEAARDEVAGEFARKLAALLKEEN